MCMNLSHFSHVQLYATPWTVTHQATVHTKFQVEDEKVLEMDGGDGCTTR